MLIGLHGKMGSGKDQSFEFIQEWAEAQGRPARRDAFADRLKVSAMQALGYLGEPEECIEAANALKTDGWEVIVREPDGRTEHPITGREYLQYYGTEGHRDLFGQDFWINLVMQAYDDGPADEIFVVTDVRFPNEAEAIRERGGHVWQVLRPRVVSMEDAHVSEQPLPTELIDHLIFNDQSLDHLRGLVQAEIERMIYVGIDS